MKKILLCTLLAGASLAASAEPAVYAIDPTHTFVTFEVKHFGTSTNRGRFDKKEGTVVLDKAAKTGKVEVTIDTSSINTGTAPFDDHLKKAFFISSEFSTARFVSDKIVFVGDKVDAVEGQLTLLGKTQPVTLKASSFNCYDNPMLKREVCGGDFDATITRSNWGVGYGLPVIPDRVHLLIQVEAIKQ